MDFYKQSDPSWGNEKLGKSNCTMARFGCLTTAMAMIIGSNPLWCVKNFKYDNNGDLLWSSNFGNFKFVQRLGKDFDIKGWLREPTHKAVVQVKNKYIGEHWLACDRVSIIGLNAIDPIDGLPVRVKRKYEITGYAIFTSK